MVAQLAFHDLSPDVKVATRVSRDHQTLRIYRHIRDRCWLDHALICGEYRLEHRTPEDFGRNFYALTWRGWLVGIEHYQPVPTSIERIQWALAALLAGKGWQPENVTQVYCEEKWEYAAHRMPRLLR